MCTTHDRFIKSRFCGWRVVLLAVLCSILRSQLKTEKQQWLTLASVTSGLMLCRYQGRSDESSARTWAMETPPSLCSACPTASRVGWMLCALEATKKQRNSDGCKMCILFLEQGMRACETFIFIL